MTELADFGFLNPGWLLLLPLAWWLVWHFWQRDRRRSMWRQVCDARLLERMLGPDTGGTRIRMLPWILAVLLTLGILAVAGPSWRSESHPMLQSVAARVVVFDLSSSMLVQDIKPDRLTRALDAARALLAAPFDGETGLVVFAGAAFVVSPLSSDANTLLAFLDALRPDTMPLDGARVDLALVSAQQLLEASVPGRGQILLITDGADDIEKATQAAFRASIQGHQVSVLAVGSIAGGPLRDPAGGLLRDARGNFVLARTSFTELQRIADVGKGAFASLAPGDSLSPQTVASLGADKLVESRLLDESAERNAANEGIWLIWLMLPLALMLFRKNLLWLLLLTVMLPSEKELHARDWSSLWHHSEQRALEAYRDGNYQQAHDLSTDPLLKGAAVYRLGSYQLASDYFGEGSTTAAYFNLGNALAQLGRFTEAVVAYQNALDLNPEYLLAADNKSLVETYLQQQLEADSAAADAAAEEGSSDQAPDPGAGPTRIGVAGQGSDNPADEQQSGSGMGASMQSGQFDPNDRFDGSEAQLEEMIARIQGSAEYPDAAQVELWLKSLPETSSDLFKRKFLRDYRRQTRQDR